MIFNAGSEEKRENKVVNGYVGISSGDLEAMKSINDHDSIERYYNNVVKLAASDVNEENLGSEICTTLFLKRKHHEKVKNYLSLGMMAASLSTTGVKGKLGTLVDTLTKKITENTTHISKIAIKYIEPDYSIPDAFKVNTEFEESREEETIVRTNPSNDKDIFSLAQEMGLPSDLINQGITIYASGESNSPATVFVFMQQLYNFITNITSFFSNETSSATINHADSQFQDYNNNPYGTSNNNFHDDFTDEFGEN